MQRGDIMSRKHVGEEERQNWYEPK